MKNSWRKRTRAAFDADVSWYRWEAQADLDTLTENVNAALKSRYAANPEAVLTKEGDAFVSREIESVGRIQGIEVLERDAGGAAVRLQIRGSEHTVQVMTEYNVRALLNLQGCTVQRGDGTTVAEAACCPAPASSLRRFSMKTESWPPGILRAEATGTAWA